VIAALYVEATTVYQRLGCDLWPRSRDANKYPGPYPVVCHPPCRGWSNLRHLAQPRPGELNCALNSIVFARRFGGVVEHPSNSLIWDYLPQPGLRDEYGGFVMHVDQCWWGHPARKRTGLYMVGIKPRDVPPYTFDNPPRTTVEKQWSSERMATPEQFARWLVAIAKLCTPPPHGGVDNFSEHLY